ncbi:MAG TPA: G1 family glutamic endopeptidase [Terriglobales bacterium]
MIRKSFIILAVAALTVSAAFAENAAPATSLTAAQIAKIRQYMHNLPNHRAQVGPATSASKANSYNWSGYTVTGTDFTNVKGSWIHPTVDCDKSPNSAVVFWVGIDGWNDDYVEQTGTGAVCDEKAVTYFAWYEFYPAEDIQVIDSITVTPGDTFSGEVSYSSKTSEFTLTITDETSGAHYKTTGTAAGAGRNSAEWIVEAPGYITGIINLSDFTKAEFGDDYTSIAETNQATDSSTSGVIKKFGSSILTVTQVDVFGNVEQKPSSLSSDGSSFYNTWKEYN